VKITAHPHFHPQLWVDCGCQKMSLCLYAAEKMVARDGIEPPTPAFSGLRSTS
jgi:hypothetical protein